MDTKKLAELLGKLLGVVTEIKEELQKEDAGKQNAPKQDTELVNSSKLDGILKKLDAIQDIQKSHRDKIDEIIDKLNTIEPTLTTKK